MALVMLTEKTATAATEKLGIMGRKNPKQVLTRHFRNRTLPAKKVGRYWFFDLEKIQDGQINVVNG